MTAAIQRSKPKTQVVFPAPIVGPSGAALTSYIWQWTVEEVVDGRGELVEKRVSDWELSVENQATGREIVHQFEVDGALVSAESAMKLLGFTAATGKPFKAARSTAQTIAKLRMAQAQLAVKRDQWEADLAGVEAMNTPAAITGEWQQCDGYRKREWQMGELCWPQISNCLGCDSDDEVIAQMATEWRREQMEQRGWSYSYQSRRNGQAAFDWEAADLAKRLKRAEAKLAAMA